MLQKAILLITLAGIIACSNDNEVLADFEGGEITRGEFRKFFEIGHGNDAIEQATVQNQDQVLKNYATLILAAQEAKEMDLEVKENLSLLTEERALITAFDHHLKSERSPEYTLIDMQFLFLNHNEDAGTDSSNRLEEAEYYRDQLNQASSDTEIEDIIRQQSENREQRVIGGLVPPHCISCPNHGLEFLTEPLQESEDNQFIVIENEQGYWITREIKQREVRESRLKQVYEDYLKKSQRIARRHFEDRPDHPDASRFLIPEEQISDTADQYAEAFLRRESGGKLFSRLEKLKNDLNYQSEYDEPWNALPSEEAILFTAAEQDIYYRDFLDSLKGEEFTAEDQYQIFQRFYMPAFLLEHDPDADNVRQSETYTFLMKLSEYEKHASSYFEHISQESEISEEEIQTTFDMLRDTHFQGQSIAQARDQIIGYLREEKNRAAFTRAQETLGEKYNLTIYRDRLKANEL